MHQNLKTCAGRRAAGMDGARGLWPSMRGVGGGNGRGLMRVMGMLVLLVVWGVGTLGGTVREAGAAQPVAAPPAATAGDEAARLRKSLVKIFTTSREPDLARPWTKKQPEESSGSGVVIEGRRILTNNHVISYASRILVQPDGSSDKLPARVVAAAPGIDLAVIELEDPTFFDAHPPLAFAENLPDVGASVTAYGYPIGGDALSVTKGIVSRIEYTLYNEGTQGLRIQVDAALNPGNSGGPACVDDKLVGVVFSGIDAAQNIGFLIPVEEINAFLEDIGPDRRFDGRPQFFGSMQTAENEALRRRLRLSREMTGLVVTRPESAAAEYPLRAWDVLTKIGPHDIDNAGFVAIRPNLRLSFAYYVPRLVRDGKVPMTIYREGEKLEVEVPVRTERNRIFRPLNGAYPSYFILGPMTFSTLHLDHASALNPRVLAARGSPILTRLDDEPAFAGERLVAGPFKMFPHAVGKGYDVAYFPVLARVNGTAIRNLEHLVQLVKASTDEFLIFEWADEAAESLVFRREELLRSTEEVLDDNGIRAQMSEDVKAVWEGGGSSGGGGGK